MRILDLWVSVTIEKQRNGKNYEKNYLSLYIHLYFVQTAKKITKRNSTCKHGLASRVQASASALWASWPWPLGLWILVLTTTLFITNITSDGKSRDSLETVFSLSWSWSWGYCRGLGLGLECSVLVSCLVETFIKTVVTFVIVRSKNFVSSFVILSVN